MSVEELKEILHEKYPEVEVREIQYEDIVFEERVRLKCCHCKNYKEKWTCPGKMPELDYRKIISEYEHKAVVISKVAMHVGAGARSETETTAGERSERETTAGARSETETTAGERRETDGVMKKFREGVVLLHRAMLYMEGELFKRNNAMAESFIGCSCQLCEEGCAAEKCRHPEQARVPWDATGCNVVKTLEKIGIQVTFPATEYMYQYGLFVW
ncbi:MAG: hypothetical protein IJS92_07670 [Paludibacteraceae bacterium]|nr:hypothetical protein [Paludibacteraceae bacterium]